MVNFIKYLKIDESEISSFYEMAIASGCSCYEIAFSKRDSCADLIEYLISNTQAQTALRLAMDMKLSDEEWETFITHLLEIYPV